MFADAPVLETRLDAIDELDSVRCSLEGLSQLVLAMKMADFAERESLALISQLLAYFALALETSARQLEDDLK